MRLGIYCKPEKCLLPCSYFPWLQTVSAVPLSGETLPVQSSALWVGNSLQGVHKDDVGTKTIFKIPSSTYFHVPIRLDSQKLGSAHSQSSSSFGTGHPLGLFINCQKSHLIPLQETMYLGALFNLEVGIIYHSEERFQNLLYQIDRILETKFCRAHMFRRPLNLMTVCIDLFPWARLHMRPIQFYLRSWWITRREYKKDDPYQLFITKHLKWWTRRENF